MDRRIQKTEALLRDALGSLVREKPYEEIVVKEILSRANVGRSTFYTRFADKNELLLSCIHDMLGPAEPDGGDLLWFSLPILEHIERHRQTGQSTMAPRSRATLHEHLRHAITELIEDEIGTAFRRRRHPVRQPPADLLVRWIATTFVLVLNWWVESNCQLSAREADDLFRALLEPSLAKALK